MTEHKELVDRLRAYAKDQGGWHNIDDTCEEAARVIEEQAAEIAKLRKALARIIEPSPGVRRIEPWAYGIGKAALDPERDKLP